ncbi:uncharacterized protein LOC136092421 [Hydra vulgaris]|uniref:Uncharacterized protein LOC136092421 n=1 Tax=Hydra vulgaris TaxID=6087 RepID=A0ABM4DQ72_HYDVU
MPFLSNETPSSLNATTIEPASIELVTRPIFYIQNKSISIYCQKFIIIFQYFFNLDLTSNYKKRENLVKIRSRTKISDLESQRSSLIIVRDSCLSTVSKKQINTVKESIRKEKTKLDGLIRELARQRKRRQKLKESIETVYQNNPEASSVLKQFIRKHPGRPRLEVDLPELLSTIIKIVQNSSAADELGLAAASIQVPLLMHTEYKVKLMDHDFVVGTQQKFIPSVYGICEFNNTGNVSYSGDTFIRIKSGKHDTSNAFTHAFDVRELFKTKLVKRRPIMLMETDGAQDKAPRFPKTLATAVDLFRLLDLDALLHVVNAAGPSAFNPVERRMTSLSHDLARIILPHDYFGNNLDSSGKTVDQKLELENILKAATVLAQVWEKTVIEGILFIARLYLVEKHINNLLLSLFW